MKKKDIEHSVDFLFEMGMLAKTPRSWSSFLGSGQQSVAEHTNRAVYIGYVLTQMHKSADEAKVTKMCLLHDIAEARVSDLNYIHQKYNERKEHKAISDLSSELPFGKDIADTIAEYEKRETIEAKLAKDADNLEFLLSLKEEIDVGNKRAKTWIPPIMKRFITEEAKKLSKVIVKTDSDKWWFGNKDDEWWVSRKKQSEMDFE